MEQLKTKIEQLLEKAGFSFLVETDEVETRVRISIHNDAVRDFFPRVVVDFEQVVKAIARRLGIDRVAVDVNNYKQERERIIVELARAAARKALFEKHDVELPVMNAYERRLVHVELATRPDVKTESLGEGIQRHIVVRPI